MEPPENRQARNSADLNGDIDLNKFTTLCSELECGMSNTYSALDEVLGLKNILLEQDLPSAVKVKITLAVGRLHRSISDMSVPMGEVTRLVRLYAVPWENKSKALKKLHQDYESKQHQLEIALRRLEIVGVQTMRMERERRIMNWEKIFAKLVGGKSHGQRWRFLIRQFKQKLKEGEDLANVYSAVSDEEEEDDSSDVEEEGKSRKQLFAQELKAKLRQFDGLQEILSSGQQTLKKEQESKNPRNSFIEEESEASINIGNSDDNYSTTSNELDSQHLSLSQTRKKVRFDETDGNELQKNQLGVPTLTGTDKKKEIVAQRVEMIEKECWTHEPDFEKLFHIRLFRPKCKTLSASWCTIVFDNNVRKSQVFPEMIENITTQEDQMPVKENDLEEKPDMKAERQADLQLKENVNKKSDEKSRKIDNFEEFSFKLLPDFETRNKEHILLKFSVHPANKKTMIAMTSVKLSDIRAIDKENININQQFDEQIEPIKLPIKAAINNSELIFNKTCGEICIVCYYSKVILPRVITRATETLSIEELTNRIIELRRREDLKRLKSAGTSMTEKPIYTEEQMKFAKEELKQQLNSLREEYEERLSLIISQLSRENQESLREFVNAATSPLFMWSESTTTDYPSRDSFSPSQIQPVKPSKNKSTRKQSKKLDKKQQVWGENLPEDFYERMEMFREESFKHHQKLKEKINEEVGKEIEKKLASSYKLDTSQKEGNVPNEVCLPALFMPTKSRNLYTPKARSYFHAFGTVSGRITQPPSILQLPRLQNDNADIVGIYESVMKQKMESVPDRENDTDLGRFSPESSSSIELAGIEKDRDDDLG